MSNKITHHDVGAPDEQIGTVTPQMIRQRAEEIALGDGRDGSAVNQQDIDQAQEELLYQQRPPEKFQTLNPPEAESLVTDEPVPSVGKQGTGSGYGQDESQATQLIRQGIEEADHDQRTESGRQTLAGQEEIGGPGE